MKNVMR